MSALRQKRTSGLARSTSILGQNPTSPIHPTISPLQKPDISAFATYVGYRG